MSSLSLLRAASANKPSAIVGPKPFTVGSCGMFNNVGAVERIDSPNGRRYKIPSGELYPSVTTVLAHHGSHDWLDEWKVAVGEELAKKYSDAGLERGTFMHQTMEKYVESSEDDVLEFRNETDKTLFTSARKGFLSGIEHVYGQELFLYSDEFRVAGATDVVGIWKGRKSIVDFKSSSSYKNTDDIIGYWMQTAMYSKMVEERTGVLCDNLVIIMAVVDEGEPLVYTRNRDDELLDMYREAREIYGVLRE